ncbi:peptidase C39 family protein [Acrocarpospora catenulata]|uniref:peptidase C39 family protein n=1 Tax=Acrocarpospora catenulata TaxID=2836182 RepID=UPI001BDA53FB|nr:peptidase C39 family protein [Acrocarpospora catenulata]
MALFSALLSALLVGGVPVARAQVAEVVYQREAGPVRFDAPQGTSRYTDALGTTFWEYDRWTSPERSIGFDATEVIPSWTADTPPGSWIQVDLRARNAEGLTKWYVMGRWAYGDRDILRTSVPGQGDGDGTVRTDTFVAADGKPVNAYQLRLTLYRKGGAVPVVRTLGATASAVPDRPNMAVSPTGGAWGIELRVPRRSQQVHAGEYPQYDGGGKAWCSPTSTAMVLGYWGKWPSTNDLTWVDPAYPDPEVDHAARYSYDHAYRGTGNWAFNTAYAGRYGLDASVTRLLSLTELEAYIKEGIPVITSQSFRKGDLPGADYDTDGHLMVVVGFTGGGDVIVNDPAAPSNATVRRVYPRAEFERAWQRGSGGAAYLIYPTGHPVPDGITEHP